MRGDEAYGDPRAVWRARLLLFIGFALMAGGLAGGVVSTLSIVYGNLEVLRVQVVLTGNGCFPFFTDSAGHQIHCQETPGTVHVLRICERLSERCSDVVSGGVVVSAEYPGRL